MGRFVRSFQLVKQSWGVLMQDKELLILPVLSGFFILLACATFIIPTGILEQGAVENLPQGLAIALGFSFYVVVYTISFFFQAALVAGSSERMNGGDPTVGSSLRAAGRRFGAIVLWGVIAATVGMILKGIENRSQGIGRFIVGLFGVAWSIATFFMVPVLVMERHSIGGSFKRSFAILKEAWGETVIGNFGLGMISFLAMLVVGGFAYLLANAGLVTVAITVGVIGVATVMVFTSALNAVFVSALYRYATRGDTPTGFDAAIVRDAFHHKGRS